jgi:hypothetical protein
MEYRKLSELKKLPSNPRKISKEQMDKLVKSIQDNKDYFKARPIILSDRTGELVIIAGNQRYEAAKKLKLKEVPTYLLNDLTEEREKEIIIRDNVANGEWDFNLLKDWDAVKLEDWGIQLPYWDDGLDVNSMTEEDLVLTEEFDPIGNSSGLQRVIFIFKGKQEAEDYLNKLKIDYKKEPQAWKVYINTQFT